MNSILRTNRRRSEIFHPEYHHRKRIPAHNRIDNVMVRHRTHGEVPGTPMQKNHDRTQPPRHCGSNLRRRIIVLRRSSASCLILGRRVSAGYVQKSSRPQSAREEQRGEVGRPDAIHQQEWHRTFCRAPTPYGNRVSEALPDVQARQREAGALSLRPFWSSCHETRAMGEIGPLGSGTRS